jgi:hypothetical protein
MELPLLLAQVAWAVINVMICHTRSIHLQYYQKYEQSTTSKAMIGFLTVCLFVIFLSFDRPVYNGRPIHSSLSGGRVESHITLFLFFFFLQGDDSCRQLRNDQP